MKFDERTKMNIEDIIPENCPQLSTSYLPNGEIRKNECGLNLGSCKGSVCSLKIAIHALLPLVKRNSEADTIKDALKHLGVQTES